MRETQTDAPIHLRELDDETVQFEAGLLGNRGESPRDLLWKYAEILVEWGFSEGSEHLAFDGDIESTHLLGHVGAVAPLPGDDVTRAVGEHAWASPPSGGARRGVVIPVLYTDTTRGHGRTILTVRTESGSFSFLPVDVAEGPILAPDSGFFVTEASAGISATRFQTDLVSQGLKSIREKVREHAEPTWEGAIRAIHGDVEFVPFPDPPYDPRMSVNVPEPGLTAMWRIGAWQIIKNCPRIHCDDIPRVGRNGDVGGCRRIEDPNDPQGIHVVRDHPFPPLSCETERILLALDHIGMHEVARDGITIWLQNQQNSGCLALNSYMEQAHRKGALQIPWVMAEHGLLTGDREWIEREGPRLKAAADWILSRRRATMNEDVSSWEIAGIEDGTWSPYGLQPPVTSGDSDARGTAYIFGADAAGHRSVKLVAEVLAEVDPQASAQLSAEAETYGRDILAVVGDAIVRSPVVKTLDGTYRFFLPQGHQDRGPRARALPEGEDVLRHCGPWSGDITQTSSSIDAWLRSGLLSVDDPWIDAHFDVLEDVFLYGNPWGRTWRERTEENGYEVAEEWFTHAGFGYQSGWERVPDYYLVKDDVPSFLRSWLNRCAVDINLENWTFNEHTTAVENDKSHGNAAFLSSFRKLLVMEIGDSLWIGRATPRAWLEQGKRISVKNAPSHFGDVAYEIVSDVANGRITATVALPSRKEPGTVYIRFRHPESSRIRSATVNGQARTDFDADREVVELTGVSGTATVVAEY